MDGVTYSNTLHFERELGWGGILIEPHFGLFKKLQVNRPMTYNFNCAISTMQGEIDFIAGSTGVGGMVHTMNPAHIKGWKLNPDKSVKVPTRKLSDLTEFAKVSRVDLFSVDVEGGELEVLETYDWSIPTYIVAIEMAIYRKHTKWTDQAKEKCEKCRDMLRKNGFTYGMNIGKANEIWINSDASPRASA
jgi:FkbM family methyltransferase